MCVSLSEKNIIENFFEEIFPNAVPHFEFDAKNVNYRAACIVVERIGSEDFVKLKILTDRIGSRFKISHRPDGIMLSFF